jgi:hypothetical protein
MTQQSKHYPPYIDLQPIMQVQGTVRLPGSKSISNRTLLLAALAQGTTEIKDLLASDDTLVMLNALQQLGVHWEQEGDSQNYTVRGVNGQLPAIRPICSWEMRALRFAHWSRRWRCWAVITLCMAWRVCMSGRLAIWSMP